MVCNLRKIRREIDLALTATLYKKREQSGLNYLCEDESDTNQRTTSGNLSYR